MKKRKLSKVFLKWENYAQTLRIMKLIVLLMTVTALQISASSYSQSTILSLELKDMNLKEMMDIIKNKSEFDFIYAQNEIEGVRVNDANFTKTNIEEILKVCLDGKSISYQIIDKVIVLKPIEVPVVKDSAQQPQTITIQGKVTDEMGEALPFVNVYIKGDNQGVITDKYGAYAIEVEEKEGMILIVSFIGFTTQEFEVAGRREINIMLKGDMMDLSEVVVTGFRHYQRKELQDHL